MAAFSIDCLIPFYSAQSFARLWSYFEIYAHVVKQGNHPAAQTGLKRALGPSQPCPVLPAASVRPGEGEKKSTGSVQS